MPSEQSEQENKKKKKKKKKTSAQRVTNTPGRRHFLIIKNIFKSMTMI